MHFPKFLAVIATVVLFAGCSEPRVPTLPVLVDAPTGGPATGPRLSGGYGEPLILSWMEEDENGAALLYSRYGAGGWSPARTVVDEIEMFVNWADMPSVQPMGGDRLSAHWLEKSADLTYAYDVVFVQSFDGGKSWTDPIRPHSDGTPTEHGFVSMFDADGSTGLIWLDGRKMVNEVTDDPLETGMTLRAAFIDTESGIHGEQLVDELVCDCCQTDIAVSASGPVAVYRDRSVNEIRDISVTRFVDGRWQPGATLAKDNWQIPACPVNGPSIIANGDFVAAAWFTATNDAPVVNLRLSENGGESFGDVIEVSTGKVLGRVGIVSIENGVAVSWVRKSEDGGNELAVRFYSTNGEPGDLFIIAHDVGAFSVPQMGVSGENLVFVWTETKERINTVHSAWWPAAELHSE